MQDDAKSSAEASKALNGQGRQNLKNHTLCVDGIIAVSVFFCGMLECHVGLGPCPSVSEASEKPNFPNLITKTFNKFNNKKQIISSEVACVKDREAIPESVPDEIRRTQASHEMSLVFFDPMVGSSSR